jgi:hypothetical protein
MIGTCKIHLKLKNAYKSSVTNSEGKRPLVNWYEFVDWIQLAQERTQWWVLVNVRNFRVS